MKKLWIFVLSLLACVLVVFAATFGDVGTVLWTNTYDSTLGNDYSYDVAVDSQGTVIVVGYVQGATNHGVNGYAIKYNPAGDSVLWDVEFDAGLIGAGGGAPILGPIYYNLYGNEFASDRCYGGAVDHEGNIIAVGHIGISGSSGSVTNNLDWHVRKYNSAGTLLWDKTYAGAANLYDLVISVDVDSNGDVFVCGYTNIGTDNSTNSDYDWLIIKYDKDDGTPLQTKKTKERDGEKRMVLWDKC